MLRMNNDGGSDYGSWDAGSYLHDDDDDDDFGDPQDHAITDGDDEDDDEEEEEYDGTDADDDEDAFDVHGHAEDNNPSAELDPAAFLSDDAFARALQDAEEREMAARLLALAGINDSESLLL